MTSSERRDDSGIDHTQTGVPTRLIGSGAGGGVPAGDELPPLGPGSVLNNTHRIDRLLARGGMGEVYRATNLLTGDTVALKVIRPELVDEPDMRALFLREAAALRRIRHPTVVAYEGVHAEANGRVYLVMELIEGPSLSKRIAERPLTVAQVRALRRCLALGLQAAHERNVVHRDLSPDNIILREGDLDRATVIDFGIAKNTDGISGSVIGSSFAGKMEYASPEQMGLFGHVVDRRSDIYSLGLVLVAAALGRPLAMAETPAVAVEKRKHVPDLSALPPALRDELTAMLQPDPVHRLATMQDVLALDDGVVPALPRPAGRRGRLATALVAVIVAAAALVTVARPAWVADGRNMIAGWFGAPATPAPDTAAEDAAWNRAQALGTAPAVRVYLTRYPSGRYAAQAQALIEEIGRREKAAQSVPGQPFLDCANCPEMTRLPAGSFLMGSTPEERQREQVPQVWGRAEEPRRSVKIGANLAMDRYEVTLGEFAQFVQATGYIMGDSCWRNPGFEQSYYDPVVCVSWADARAYAAWLSQLTGMRYRLPSEAEWEYAARGGTATARYWGDDVAQICTYANVLEVGIQCADSHLNTAPVGTFRANAFGLFDMLGNVSEWTEDCWFPTHDEAPADGSARSGSDCAQRVVRGGSWNADPWRVRAATRSGIGSATRNAEIGFRVVRTD